MLFQAILTQRIIIVLITQIWPVFYCSYFAYKLLTRAKNRAIYSISGFFVTLAMTYFFATISVFVLNTPFAYLFYIIGIYFFFFSHSFFVIISWVLGTLDKKSPRWKYITIIILYGIISTYIFWIGYFLGGITYDSSTYWVPTYSWSFLAFSWGFIILFLILPQIYYSVKLRKVFEGAVMRRRINLFIFGISLELEVVIFLFLYNTLVDNQIFRIIFIIITPAVSTIAGYLLYRSFGKELE